MEKQFPDRHLKALDPSNQEPSTFRMWSRLVLLLLLLSLSCRSGLGASIEDVPATTPVSDESVTLSDDEEVDLSSLDDETLPSFVSNVDVDDYLKNTRAVHFQIKCVLAATGATQFCDPIGKWLRGVIPELIRNGCHHCSPELRKKAGKIVAHIQQNHPEAWNEGVRRFGQTTPVSRDNAASATDREADNATTILPPS